MYFFIIVFLIVNLLIIGMDKYFYNTVSDILHIEGLNSDVVLKSLGYYNESVTIHGPLKR